MTSSPTLNTSLGWLTRPQRHVGDVEQAVDAAEVDERAVLGDVLDGAGDDHALFEVLRASCAFSSSRSFSRSTRRESTMLPRFLLNLMTLNS